MNRCCCCPRDARCPLSAAVAGEVLRNPSSEHCAVVAVGERVLKYLKPSARMDDWAARKKLADAHSDLIEPFDIVGRVIDQKRRYGHGSDEESHAILMELRRRGACVVYDGGGKNVVGGKLVDFLYMPKMTRRIRGVARELRRIAFQER